MSADTNTLTHNAAGSRTAEWNEAWESGDVPWHDKDVNRLVGLAFVDSITDSSPLRHVQSDVT